VVISGGWQRVEIVPQTVKWSQRGEIWLIAEKKNIQGRRTSGRHTTFACKFDINGRFLSTHKNLVKAVIGEHRDSDMR